MSNTCAHRDHGGNHEINLYVLAENSLTLFSEIAWKVMGHADSEVLDEHESTVRAILTRADDARGRIEVTQAEMDALQAVMESGADYMHSNGYAYDLSFPADALAAKVVDSTGAPITICWKGCA